MLEVVGLKTNKTLAPNKKRIVLGVALMALTAPMPVLGEERFSSILLTKSFQGSWQDVQALGWLGAFNSYFIMLCGVLGMLSVSSGISITMLYYSNRNLWDSVWDYQEEDQGSGFMGLKGIMDKVKQGSRGVGFNAFIQAIIAAFPNVRYYSEVNPNRLQHNLKPEDGMGTWLLKTFTPKALMIFFFSAGFDGSLVRGYYTIANGFSAVADRMVTVDLEAWVNRKMDTGQAYQFTLGGSGELSNQFAEKVAKSLYSQVIGRSSDVDSSSLQKIGLSIEQTIYTDLVNASSESARREKIRGYLPDGLNNAKPALSTDADMKALNYDITVNSNPDKYTKLTYQLTDFMKAAGMGSTDHGSGLYAHITITKENVKQNDFFQVIGATPAPTKKP